MQQRQLTEKEKKDRYFQEQKRKLRDFGRSGRSNLSLDMTSSLVENLGGSGAGKPKQGIAV